MGLCTMFLNVFAVTQCGNDSRCLNGGTCVNEEFCVCPDNFVGSRCEHGNYLSVLEIMLKARKMT